MRLALLAFALSLACTGAAAQTCPNAKGLIPGAPAWNGWSPDAANTRYQARPALTAAQVPRLKVKWSFAYPGGKNSQATVFGGRVFVASTAGLVYALDAGTGCVRWRLDGVGGVRAAPVVGRLAAAPSGYAVYFGDDRATLHAADAGSGRLLWRRRIDDHPRAVISGAPVLHAGRLYVPLSSTEQSVANDSGYACCSFRGAVAAVDAADGRLVWKAHTIDRQAAPTRMAGGKQLTGPAGAAIWASPTVDAGRGLLYVTTGDSYTDVSVPGADAVIAIDLADGKVRWTYQATADDNFLVGCPRRGDGQAHVGANCPLDVGPDHDFGASAVLARAGDGRELLLAGQKSGVVHALDPATGRPVWIRKVGQGGPVGGVQFGMAAHAGVAYVAVSDSFAEGGPPLPGLNALDIGAGKTLWRTPTPTLAPAACSLPRRQCETGQSAAVSAIPGVVFSGALDGHLRAYAAEDGKIVWDFDTGALPHGGALDGGGPTVAGGMVFQHSGYAGYAGSSTSPNLLIAFSVDGK